LGEGANYLLPTTTKSSAVFAFVESTLSKKVRLQAGARVEQVKVEGTPVSDEFTSRTFTPTSGSIGLVFDATDAVRLGLTLSSAARAPGQTELFARGPHDGPRTFETGDATLDVERANSLEGSFRLHNDKVKIEASLWGAKFDHYIFGQLTGRTCDDDGACVDDDSLELKELNYVQVGATFWGAEAKSTVVVFENARGAWNIELLADYVHAITADQGPLPRITPYHVGGGLSWIGKTIDGGVFVKYTGARDDVAFAETPTDGYVSVDAHLGWHPLLDKPSVEIALVGHNLTDTLQRNAIALNKDDVIMPGRDIRLIASARF
jgi:iron complex outermembrane receptor protein